MSFHHTKFLAKNFLMLLHASLLKRDSITSLRRAKGFLGVSLLMLTPAFAGPSVKPDCTGTDDSPSSSSVVGTQMKPEVPAKSASDRAELLAQASKLAKLETEIARDAERYEKRPRRKVFGATAVGVNYARYVEDWRTKVEAIGNLNYPQQARDKNLSGTLQLLVALRADGTVERIELRRSSGQPILDEAAQRIVELGAPYAPFPDALRKDTDILEVIRTWTFSRDQRLHAESQ